MTLRVGQPEVQFETLLIGERNRSRFRDNTVPNGLNQLDAIVHGKLKNIFENPHGNHVAA